MCSLRVSGVQAASTPELTAPPSVCGERQEGYGARRFVSPKIMILGDNILVCLGSTF